MLSCRLYRYLVTAFMEAFGIGGGKGALKIHRLVNKTATSNPDMDLLNLNSS